MAREVMGRARGRDLGAVGAAVCGGRTRRMSRPSAAVAADDARYAAARLPSVPSTSVRGRGQAPPLRPQPELSQSLGEYRRLGGRRPVGVEGDGEGAEDDAAETR